MASCTFTTYFLSSRPKPRSAWCCSNSALAAASPGFLRRASSAVTAWMPLAMRSRFFALISWMPGISWLMERVPIRPITQGISISQSFFCSASLMPAMSFRPAGAGSVSHMASSAAILVCCASPTV
ncbi:hypothetical protein D9M68_741940 [compost metagenome]